MRYFARLFFGFVAGFVAVLAFHQGMLTLLHLWGVTARTPFPMQPTKPFGVPVIWSLSFWGGAWGIVFAIFDRLFPKGVGYWPIALIFGAIFPTLVALLLVPILKGLPMPGWNPSLIMTGLLVNGAWGIGTALFLRGFAGR